MYESSGHNDREVRPCDVMVAYVFAFYSENQTVVGSIPAEVSINNTDSMISVEGLPHKKLGAKCLLYGMINNAPNGCLTLNR